MISQLQSIADNLLDAFAKHQLSARELEHQLLELIAMEIQQKQLDRATWVKAYSEAEGNRARTEAVYIKLRLRRLMDKVRSAQLNSREVRAPKEGRQSLVITRPMGFNRKLQGNTVEAAMLAVIGLIFVAIVVEAFSGGLNGNVAIEKEYHGAVDDDYYSDVAPVGDGNLIVDRPEGFSPSFECRQALQVAEQLICSSPDLARRDVEMALAYNAALRSISPSKRRALTAAQRSWLIQRNACLSASCVDKLYDQWFADFSKQSAIASRGAGLDPIVEPNITSAWSYYRTKIQEGWRFEPTMGGRYVVIRMGCGTGCTINLVGDHRSGNIFHLGLGGEEMQSLELKFDDSSTQVQAQWLDTGKDACQLQTYDWTGIRLVPVSQVETYSRGDGCVALS